MAIAKNQEPIVRHAGFCGSQVQASLVFHQSQGMRYSCQPRDFSFCDTGKGGVDYPSHGLPSPLLCQKLNTTHGPGGSRWHNLSVRPWQSTLPKTLPLSQWATHPITCRSGSSCSPSIAVAVASSHVLLGQCTALRGPRQMKQRRVGHCWVRGSCLDHCCFLCPTQKFEIHVSLPTTR